MEGIFSTREVAIALWVIGLLVWGAGKKEFRKSLTGLCRAFLRRQILVIFGWMTAYIVITVFFLRQAELWDVRQLKDTILWAVFVGGASMFRLTAIARDSSYFKETIKDNLKLIVYIEFVVSVFVFSLLTELIIVPMATIVALMLVLSERDNKLSHVTKILNGVAICFGIWLLLHAIYELSRNFIGFANVQTLADFSLTPILTICFFPFLFVTARFVHHELFMLRLRQAIKEPRLRGYAYRRAMFRFNFGVAALDRWALSLFSRNITDKVDVDRSIDRILAMLSVERNPPLVPPAKGWSPYLAKDFLKGEGFKTKYYTSYDDKEWYASASRDVEKSSLDTIEYTVEGNREAATSLKLVLNAYEGERLQPNYMSFLEVFRALYKAALQKEIENGFEELEKSDHRWIVDNCEISLRKEVWRHRSGCELEISIKIIDADRDASA